ncbi:MAG: phosphoglycerate mutase [Candidatus Bipolaricaulia bacterium]
MGKKILLITLDGVGDRPAQVLGNKTPLEAADTPNLDALAAQGINGVMTAIAPGVPAPSDVAHYLIFGYPLEWRPGRSVFEATGYGVAIAEDEVICSTSLALAELRDGIIEIVTRRDMGLTLEEGRALVEAVPHYQEAGIELELIYTAKWFGILKMRGEVSHQITDSDPFYDDLPVLAVQPMVGAPEAAERTAHVLNNYLRWTYRVLSQHEVNRARPKATIILTKWPGRKVELPSFQEKYNLNGLSISPKPVINGLARYLGIDTKFSDLETADREYAYGIEQLNAYDFVHIHDLRPDVIAHKKDPVKKVETIEKIDRDLKVLTDRLPDPSLVVAITADHSTLSTEGTVKAMHAGEPVPIVVVAEGVRTDAVSRFSERDGVNGGLGHIRAMELMNILMNYTNRLGNYGFRPRRFETDQASYRPTDVKPLTLPPD